MRLITLLPIALIILLPIAYGYYHPSMEEVKKGEIELVMNPMNPMAGEPIEFTINIVSTETGNLVPHIDYRVVVMKDGVELFRREFHDHEGDLKLRFIPSSEMDVKSMPEGFEVYGMVFSEPGTYEVIVSVIGIEFNPIDPFSKTFTIEVGGEAVERPMDEGMAEDEMEEEMEAMDEMDMTTMWIIVAVAVAAVVAGVAAILKRGA